MSQPVLRTLLSGRAGLVLAGLLALATRPAAAQWTRQNSGLTANAGIGSISIVDASTVWATGYNGTTPAAAYNTYTRTTNGGSTWTTGTIAAAGSYAFTSLSAASSTVAWAACNGSSGGGYLYYTADGSTWTRQLSTGFPAGTEGFLNGVLAFSAAQAVAVGDPLTTTNVFEIYTTSNAGSTWTAATTSVTRLSGEYGNAGTLATVPGTTAGARACWLGTSAGRVLRSTDSGVTWAAAATGLASVTAVAFCSATTGVALNADNPSLIAYTTNGGQSWSTRTPTGPYYTTGLAGVPGLANAFVSTGNDNFGSGSAYSLDGGATWTSLDAGVAHTAVAFLNGSTGWSGGFATSATVGGIYKGTLPAAALPTTAALAAGSLEVYPNPATSAFAVRVPAVAGAGQVQATLLNALGQEVARQTAALPAAGTELAFATAGLGSGVYLLRVQAGAAVAARRVVVQ